MAAFVPSLGLSCWTSLHADPPSFRPDTDTGVDINPNTCRAACGRGTLQISRLDLFISLSRHLKHPRRSANRRKAGILCCPACHVILLTCSKCSRSPEVTLQFDQTAAESLAGCWMSTQKMDLHMFLVPRARFFYVRVSFVKA